MASLENQRKTGQKLIERALQDDLQALASVNDHFGKRCRYPKECNAPVLKTRGNRQMSLTRRQTFLGASAMALAPVPVPASNMGILDTAGLETESLLMPMWTRFWSVEPMIFTFNVRA